MKSDSPFKLITFDLDNTLWPVDDVIRAAEKASNTWLQQEHPKLFEELSKEEIKKIRMKTYTDNSHLRHDLSALRTLSLKQLFLTIDYEEAHAQEQAEEGFKVFHHARNKVEFYPDAISSLRELTQSFVLGALTNGNASLEKIGVRDLFQFHLSSENVGHSKPHPAMFEKALILSNASAAESIHVGDHPEQDIMAAKTLGFTTIWINHEKEEWPDEFEGKPDLELNSLADLVSAIKKL